MTPVATKTLAGAKEGTKAVGTFFFRAKYPQDAGATTVVEFPTSVPLVDGKMPSTNFPAGTVLQVRREINGLDPKARVAWKDWVVPTGTPPSGQEVASGVWDLYRVLDQYVVHIAPVVQAAQTAAALAVQKAAEAAAVATSLSAITAGAPEDFDTFAEVAAGKYAKPSSGIPKADLASAVQTSLGKADAAVPKTTADASYASRKAFAASTAATATLAPGAFDQVDASGGNRTRKLAAGGVVDDQITVKVSAIGAGNTVTIQGDTGVTASTITLTALNQAVTLSWTGSAWVVSGRDNPTSYLTATFAQRSSSVGSYTYDANGNVTATPDGTAYTWESDGLGGYRVKTETVGSTVRTYTYNSDGSLGSIA